MNGLIKKILVCLLAVCMVSTPVEAKKKEKVWAITYKTKRKKIKVKLPIYEEG